MNNIDKLFATKEKNILSVYFTAGYPTIHSTTEVIKSLVKNGADMIEVGIPFSDPMADGVTIQQSSSVAIKNGMNLTKLFEQIKEVRLEAKDTPLILMGYINPMLQYGIDNLYKKCKEVGIDGLIIPDLPFADYLRDFKPLSDKYNIPVIMLITPETSNERIQYIDDNCNGFIYMVSSASTTGTRDHFESKQIDYFKRIENMKLKNKRLIGFGISNESTMNDACQYSSGGIIGSLFVKLLGSTTSIDNAAKELVKQIGRI